MRRCSGSADVQAAAASDFLTLTLTLALNPNPNSDPNPNPNQAAEQQLGSDAWPVRGSLLAPPSYHPTLPGYHPTRCAARSSRRHC